MNTFKSCCLGFAAMWLTGACAQAGDKTLMHCFAWTPVKEASPADWTAFYKASDALPKKIKGIRKVWYGKLVSPLSQTAIVNMDESTFARYNAGANVTGEVRSARREYGMCVEMADEAALKVYDSDPYHKIWTEAYSKIRVEGTTTFDFIGQ